MRHEYWRHHRSDHNSATSGIAPLGTTHPSADPRESQLPRPTLSRDCSRSVTLGATAGSQAKAGLRAAERLLGRRNIRRHQRPKRHQRLLQEALR